MTNIIDVAKRAAVSTATVSRVISRPEKVSEQTRERVQKAIAELKYEPNHAARMLRTFRASKILVTVPDIANPFFAALIQGAEERARLAGYAVILGDTQHDAVLENQYAAMLLHRDVDGFVFLGHRLPEKLKALLEQPGRQAPIVNGCEYSPGLDVPSVHIDNALAAADAIDHLAGLGHRDIGIITGPLVSPLSRDRLYGVERAAARHLISRGLRIQHGDFSVECGVEHGRALIAEGVTAIFSFSDEMAMGVLHAITQAGLSCPQDVSVIGFDNIQLARFLTPTLTTVAQPTRQIGEEAVGILLRIIDGEEIRSTVTLPHQLIERQSTARAPQRS
ncbi:MAG TPA: LacI family DNA-binding transcriptional regulator [Sphingomonas sp.]|uniref:LacI family DNA-binding transcriptional regulator n=1 Tax=Sphingomonas sp. TaxID=28214 RepID=UPI002CBEAEEF|nr:LacI family DNA-binding transcriptional regulator [Sphingomonas sp.]HMI19149.1 LacI family DNA-binding transcriptional regulator [Sphingomonas sp.]